MNIEAYKYECARISEVIRYYADKCYKVYTDISNKVTREEYGIAGECLHRGYYCPSLIFDIVVGNVKRGQSVNKQKPNERCEFIYGFDGKDDLLIVDRKHSHEFIIYDGPYALGITFNNNSHIETVAECYYKQGKLKSYLFATYDPSAQKVIEITEEQYTYLKDVLIVDWYRFLNMGKESILEHNKYHFVVNDGYLSTYTTESYQGQARKSSIWDNHIFKVKKRRRI